MSFETVFTDIIIHRIGWWVLHFTWQGILIALFTGLLLFALQKASAHLRYSIACCGLVLMILIPAITVTVENPRPLFQSGSALIQNDPVEIKDFEEEGRLTSRQFRRDAITIPVWISIQNFVEIHLVLITMIWICGVFLISFYRLFGFIQLHFIIRSIKEPIDALWEKRIRGWINHLQIRQKILNSSI
ncbi:hypothetical protein HQ585_05150 [candidate division KSB1 bacterium]|nr:hypothetical protein [candidate division KSB1 bacterium]